MTALPRTQKTYSIEVPLYSTPLKRLASFNNSADIDAVVYGGAPNSPLNGGRNNFTLDKLKIPDRFSFCLTRGQLKRVVSAFYEAVEALNRNGISFRLAFTNMFVNEAELSEENLSPVARISELSRKYGIKNGIIINNPLLEGCIRRSYGDSFTYVSSCTKYVSPHRILGPKETLSMYAADCAIYDFVCLTPQDSRRPGLLKEAAAAHKNKIIAIANSYCSDACNSYFHYERTSRENKRSLLRAGLVDLSIVAGSLAFISRHARTCTALSQAGRGFKLDSLVRTQLDAGIVHFKLGRGFGDNLLDRLVSCIMEFEKGKCCAGAPEKDIS